MDSYREQTLAELSAVEGMAASDLKRRRAPEKWSVAEILEHLLLAYTATTRGAQRCLESGRPTAGKPTLYQRLGALLVVTIGYFPPGRRAPEMVKPRGTEADNVLRDIRGKYEEMDDALHLCEQRLGSGKLADHPVLGPLTAREWRRFHWVHTRHHMKQVRALLAGAKAAAGSGF
jgi:hypothetical protein